ncbi:MAG: response regulator [Verrucomicrobiota bacterium]|jgi:PAS domain S-box-containing protein
MKASLRILNLEDNLNDAELNAKMLSARWPHCEFVRVDTRTDFVAALEQKNFDLILSDYSIPAFNGREALSLAHEKSPGTPFLFVSGTIGEDTAIEALKNGATDYVLKQRLMRLIPAVDRALREAAERAECERAEQCMRESEHKYRQVFENLGEAAFLMEELTGKIVDTNRCAEKMLGCGRGEILGRKQDQFLTVLDRAKLMDKSAFECTMNQADGNVLQVQVHVTKLTVHTHSLVLWLCREIAGH